jgi:hypothetical protein
MAGCGAEERFFAYFFFLSCLSYQIRDSRCRTIEIELELEPLVDYPRIANNISPHRSSSGLDCFGS